MVEEKLEKKSKFDVGLKMITYADKKGIIIDKAQLAVSFCMYSDDLASCQTAAEGGVFNKPVEMDLWNADDYVVSKRTFLIVHIFFARSQYALKSPSLHYSTAQYSTAHHIQYSAVQ